MKFRKVVKRFLQFVKQSNRKENTLRHYRGRIKEFRKRLGHRKINKLRLEDVEGALAKANHFKDGRPKAPDTRRSNAVVLQQVFAFAVRRRYLRKKLFDKLERPRARHRERIPTDEENAAIETRADPAFRLVFRALRQCGARPGELARAQIDNWDRGKRLLILKDHKTATSTGQARKISVGEKLEALFLEAIGDRTAGHIFLDRRGNPWTTAKLSAVYRRLKKSAGLPDDLCLYLQRHQHATILVEKAGIHAASKSLGHTSITTTQRYVHTDDSRMPVNQDLVDA